MKKEHKWFNPETNTEYDSIATYIYKTYIDTCKKVNISPRCILDNFNKIVHELETSSASFKERAEMENEKDPTIQYILEEDSNGKELIILEVHFMEKGEFDVSLYLILPNNPIDKNNE